jgi:predicted dehydrogenase
VSQKIGVGVIGCGGRVGGLLTELLKDPRVQIAALHDTNPDQVQNYRNRFKTEAPVYENAEALVRAPGVDWVMIASWNCAHAAQAIAAMRAGKHVFCEKPLATTLQDCLDVHHVWRESGRLLAMGFTLRYSPHYRQIQKIIAAGEIGQIISMEFNETLDFNHGGFIMSNWRNQTRNAGSYILEKCCHDIDLANWMTGSLARRVASFGGCNFFTPENAHHHQRLKKNAGQNPFAYSGAPGAINPFTCSKDIFDNQVVILEFANSVRATFHTNCSTGILERRMYICGTEGTLRADVITGKIELKRIGFDTVLEDRSTEASGGHGGGDGILVDSLLKSMFEGAKPSAGLEDGLKSALTCFAVDQAVAAGEVVDLSGLWQRAGISLQ